MHEAQAAVNEIRTYLDDLRPDYVVVPVRWTGHPQSAPLEAALARRDGEFLAPWIGRNLVYHRFGADDEFHRDHELVRAFEYARGSHLLVFARRDVRAAIR